MKKLILFITLWVSALISRAQTVQALADSSFAKKDYYKAAEYYQQALKADRNNVKDLRRVGYCFINFQGQELSATQYFNRALKIEPKDPLSNYYMGIIFMDAAKNPNHKSEKASFRAKAATYLNLAVNYGSKEAKAAINELNGI